MKMAMISNKVLGKYDLKHNSISEEGIEEICKILEEATHVQNIAMSEWITSDGMNMLQEALAKNKPVKGKKGGKKKKK